MNSEQLQQYIKVRNYLLTLQEYQFVTDINQHPQLDHIIYNPKPDDFQLWDKHGNEFRFKVKKYGTRNFKNNDNI